MSNYIFTVARTSEISHAVARKKAERVVQLFIAANEPLRYREEVKTENTVEFLIHDSEGAEFGKILVYMNCVIFMTYGPLAQAEAWSFESEITDLMDGEFQQGKVKTSA